MMQQGFRPHVSFLKTVSKSRYGIINFAGSLSSNFVDKGYGATGKATSERFFLLIPLLLLMGTSFGTGGMITTLFGGDTGRGGRRTGVFGPPSFGTGGGITTLFGGDTGGRGRVGRGRVGCPFGNFGDGARVGTLVVFGKFGDGARVGTLVGAGTLGVGRGELIGALMGLGVSKDIDASDAKKRSKISKSRAFFSGADNSSLACVSFSVMLVSCACFSLCCNNR
jgi:hypothetical protein